MTSDYDPSAFPPFAVTTDLALFSEDTGALCVVVVRRRNDPYSGAWALPGGFVEIDEDLETAAVREMAEETGIVVSPTEIRQLGAYGAPDRDPRMRVVTVVYWGWRRVAGAIRAGSDAAECRIARVDDLLAEPSALAFDHHRVISDAVAALEESQERS
jgi:8-oxo-dGTP diphosphatase